MVDLVSIIIPTYNLEEYIGQALESVLNQTYQHFEIIVIDDGSKDRTREAVNAFRDVRIQVIDTQGPYGPAAARNRGLACCHGEWVAVLDGDDWWDSTRISRLLTLAYSRQAQIVADNLWLITNGHKRPWNTYFSEAGISWTAETTITIQELARYDLGILKPIFRTQFLKRHDLQYNESILHGEDFVLLLECLRCRPVMVVTPEPLYFYRNRPGSLIADETIAAPQSLATVEFLEERYGSQHELAPVLEYRRKLAETAVLVSQIRKHIRRRQWGEAIYRLLRHRTLWGPFGRWLLKAGRRKLLKTGTLL